MGWAMLSGVRSGIAKAAVLGALIAIPALGMPALAQAAPTDPVCIARPAVTICYVFQTVTGAPPGNDIPGTGSYSASDDTYVGDSGGGGAGGG